MRHRLVIVALFLGSLLACSTPSEQASRTTVSTHRIISLVPAVTEMLFAIGAGPDVVGVSSFDRFPPEVESIPKVGALLDPDFERILTLRPTLVVAYASQEELLTRLERASIPTYRYQHAVTDALSDIPKAMRELGERAERSSEAAFAAATLERELDEVRRRVGTRRRPETALVFGREPGALRGIYVSGGVGFLHDLLLLAGGSNSFADVPRESLQASAEIMLTRRPEVILELRTSTPANASTDAERAVWNSLSAIPAVRTNRVYILTDPSLAIPGPRIGRAARTLFTLLHE
jgi:iron complex transport system substrate-binding protein